MSTTAVVIPIFSTAAGRNLSATCDALPAISLERLNAAAALQTRVDRKYLVPAPIAAAFVAMLADGADIAALEIAQRRIFRYSSVYFDTPALTCFTDHRQGKRRRFKVRTRTYVDSNTSLLEVKTTGPRGATVKHRLDYAAADAAELTDHGRAFVDAVIAVPELVDALRPMLRTDYDRITLADRGKASRITIDLALAFSTPGGPAVPPTDTVVIETKSAGGRGTADAALKALGIRPTSVSKYCVGIGLTHPEVAANKWHRVLRRHFGADVHRGAGVHRDADAP